MKVSANENYSMTEEKEKTLYSDALIFFDTSVLLDFYYYSESTKSEIYKNLFKKIEDRLWISNQTKFEFLKNKEVVKGKIASTYDNLLKESEKGKDTGHVETIEKFIDEIIDKTIKSISGQLKTLQQKTSRSDKHPFFKDNFFDAFYSETELLKNNIILYKDKFKKFKTEIISEIEIKKN